MAGQNQPQKTQDQPAVSPMEALAAMNLSTGQGASASIGEYFALQLRREKDREAREEEARRQEQQVRLEGAQAANRERKKAENAQRHCTHRFEHTGRPNTGGVRSTTGMMGVTCGLCGKSWEGTELEIRTEIGPLFPEAHRITGQIMS